VASRLGDVQIAAHQVAWQLWYFLALCLDAIAIAGQAIVGRYLGAGDEQGTRSASGRMLQYGFWFGVSCAVAVIVTKPLLVDIFTHDASVRHQLGIVLWAVALMQPVAGLVFVLDGILIGAGDTRYLAKAMAAATALFVPCAIAVLTLDGSLLALWGALYLFVLARLYGMAHRYRGRAWLVTGAEVS
jgi:Na+-driven multidrug efflux pump